MRYAPVSVRTSLFAAGMLLLAVLSGCASSPPASDGNVYQGARIAQSQAGAPYRYGGSSPRGFDCSGLVYYAYRKAGVRVPRTTREQYRHAEHISLADIRRGDLLFFKLSSRGISHVGIYTGKGRFIHAPSSGKRVMYSSLENPYWKHRLLAAGRID